MAGFLRSLYLTTSHAALYAGTPPVGTSDYLLLVNGTDKLLLANGTDALLLASST